MTVHPMVELFMDQTSFQALMNERQQLFFAIMIAVYESEFPITLETIAYQIKPPCFDELINGISSLLVAGYLKVHVQDGIVNYRKPASINYPLLPLPYYRLLD